MAQQDYKVQIHGLFTNPSTFTDVPPGIASAADNLNIDRENIATTRRGFEFYGNPLGTGVIKNLIQYQNALIASTSDNLLWYDSNNEGLWAQYPGTYTPPSNQAGSRIRSIQANKNVYLTTNLGIYKTDVLANAPYQAGAPKGLGGTATINNSGGSGFMTNDTFVGYEVVWGYTDANDNLILGPPSELVVVGNTSGGPIATTGTLVGGTGYANGTYNNVPLIGGSGISAQATFVVSSTTVTSVVITNNGTGYRPNDILTVVNSFLGGTGSGFSATVETISGGTANVNVNFLMPKGVQINWIYQVYRSLESNDFLLDPNAVPSANLFLTFQGNVNSTDISNGYISFTDITPDNLLGTELYDDPDQQGSAQDNWSPPLAQDIAVYKNYTFYSNTRTVQTLQNESLIASGPPNGIQVGDTLTFTDSGSSSTFTLTGDSVETPSTGHFQVFSTGDPALDITNTAQSMLRVLNQYSANDFIVGYYLSSFTQTPGQLLFQKLTLDQPYFYVNSSRSTCFSPSIPTSGNLIQSTNDVSPNRLYYSKFLQPDAVPLLNSYDIGSAVEPIDRILPLRDGLMILKQDGIYRLSGTAPPFTVELIDNSCKSISPNSADILNNTVYFLSDIGVVSCSEQGVNIISRPIENLLLANTSPQLFPNLQEVSFGTAYNSDKRYILALPNSGTDILSSKQYVYNYVTQQWTSWSKPMSSGIVNAKDGKLYLGNQLVNSHYNVLQERKNFTAGDLADESYTVSITAINGLNLTVVDASNTQVGGTIQQILDTGPVNTSVITAVDTVNNIITVADLISLWATGDATVYTPIPVIFTTVQLDCNNAGILKHISDISFIFSVTQFPSITVNYQSDLTSDVVIAPITVINTQGWGEFAWGAGPWGGGTSAQKRLRSLVPRSISRCNWLLISLSNNLCFADFGLSGTSITFNPLGSRQGHG